MLKSRPNAKPENVGDNPKKDRNQTIKIVSQNQPKIIKVKELLTNDNLKIPSYQRPYKWTTKNVNQLIDDVLIHKEKSEYRLGTLVVHNHNGVSDIVDGQNEQLL